MQDHREETRALDENYAGTFLLSIFCTEISIGFPTRLWAQEESPFPFSLCLVRPYLLQVGLQIWRYVFFRTLYFPC